MKKRKWTFMMKVTLKTMFLHKKLDKMKRWLMKVKF